MSIDSIGNFLTIIRNGVMASKRFIVAPYSSVKQQIATVLKQEGFIDGYEVIEDGEKRSLKIFLRYVDGESVIHELTRISTPGCRQYSKVVEFKPIKGNFGIYIVSTNKGIMTDKQAKEMPVGGEVLCSVW